jgi:hypothetical protein
MSSFDFHRVVSLAKAIQLSSRSSGHRTVFFITTKPAIFRCRTRRCAATRATSSSRGWDTLRGSEHIANTSVSMICSRRTGRSWGEQVIHGAYKNHANVARTFRPTTACSPVRGRERRSGGSFASESDTIGACGRSSVQK